MADYNADSTNKIQDNRSFANSGSKAGVESGLSSVESLPRGQVQAQQQAHGLNFRQERDDEAAGSKNGKSFTIR